MTMDQCDSNCETWQECILHQGNASQFYKNVTLGVLLASEDFKLSVRKDITGKDG